MKNRTTRILAAFVLLLCFTTGQIIVFTHSHVSYYTKINQTKHSTPAGTEDNCKICQLNHNTVALLNIELNTTVIYGSAFKQLQVAALSYQSISLVLAATRGPPAV